VVAAIADLERFIAAQPDVGKVVSYVDFLLPLHRGFAPERAKTEPLPGTRNLVAQYLLLYGSASGPDSLSALLDAGHQWALVTAFTRNDEAQYGRALVTSVREFVVQRFAGVPARVHVAAGSLGLHAAMNDEVVHEKLRNLVQVAIIIGVLSSLALRSVAAGGLVLVPLAAAVLVNLGVMGWLAIPLSFVTAAITAMGVSVGADFAIYLLYRIREERRRGLPLREAVRESFGTAGEAVCFVSSAIVGGYLTLMLAGFRTWTQLGGLTALMITASALATLTLVPALVLTLRPRFIDGAGPPET
jgi:predicted RND superfamily exporter protein